MKIVIPSHKRSDRVIPLTWIPESFSNNTYIAVRSGEQADVYSAAHGKRVNHNIIAFDNLNGIGDKRNAIARYFAGEKIWMIDDDCTLHNATLNEEKNRIMMDATRTVNETEFYECISYITDLLDKYPLGSVRPAIFPKGKESWPYAINKWTFTNAFLNLGVVNADLLQYNKYPLLEDLCAFLNTIHAGHDTVSLSKWMFKTAKPGKPGGITEFRTAQITAEVSKKIREEFPQYTYWAKGFKLKGYDDSTEDRPLVLGVKIPPRKTHSTNVLPL